MSPAFTIEAGLVESFACNNSLPSYRNVALCYLWSFHTYTTRYESLCMEEWARN